MKNDIRIALTGGGSGGHIYPLIAVAEALQKYSVEKKIYADIRYFGPKDGYGAVFEEASVKTTSVTGGKIRRYFSLMNLLDIPKSFIGLFQAFFKLYFYMPDVLFSKGGTGSFSVVFAAWFYRVPIIIHESDARPGLNNLLSARFAKRIAVAFEKAAEYFDPKKTAVTGTPVRKSLAGDRPGEEQAKESLGFDSKQPLILVLGGSQGAQRINEIVILMLKDLMQITQILHQTGIANITDVEKLSRTALLGVPVKNEAKNRYKPVAYLENEMKTALAAADLVIARAGSSTIFEIAAFAKPSVLIPLPESANGHQKTNAYEFSKTGAASVIEEANLLPGVVLAKIKETLGNEELLNKMSLAAGNFFKPQAAEVIAEEILKLAGI